MIGHRWKLIVMSIIYLYWCEVKAGREETPSNLNKLEYWQRDPLLEDTRRLQKKQTRADKKANKYPRNFKAEHYINESNQVTSSDLEFAGEANKNNHKNQQEQQSPLHESSEHNHSSVNVWQNYAKKNNFKTERESTSKYLATDVTEIKHNTGFNHIHFKKISDNERLYKWMKGTVYEEKIKKKYRKMLEADMNRTKSKSTFGGIQRWSIKDPVVTTKTTRPAIEKRKDRLDNTKGLPIPKNLGDTTPKQKQQQDEFLSPYAIKSQVTQILATFPDTNVTTEVLGRTAEFNDIVLFKISSTKNNTLTRFRSVDMHKYDDSKVEKKIIFIVHGLTVMGINSVSYLAEQDKFKILLGYYLEHLNNFDIYFIPMANPDGFVASKEKNFWNKNMSPQADCRGVMLDRNFDVAWNNSHYISSCSQAFPGPTPFSEIESKVISNVFHYHGHKILAYIHVHAGTYDALSFKGDAVLYPRGHTDVPGDDDKYLDMKGEIDESMRNATFRIMSVTMDTLYHWYGKVTGTSVDYADQIYGITFALEFVMQLYHNDFFASADEELVDYNALTQIWRRIIYVVFRYFAKSAGIIHEDKKK